MTTAILRPDAPGDFCNIPSQVGAPCPNHWANLDDIIPDEDASYIWAHAATTQYFSDIYNIPTAPLDKIDSLRIYARVKRIGGYAYAFSAYIIIKTHGTLYPSSHYNTAGTAWSMRSHLWTLNPFTNEPWTQAEIDDLQIGITLRIYFGVGWVTGAACTQLYVEVTSTPAIPTGTTDPATGIGVAAATPNGTLDDDGGEACDCGFEWGETPAYGNTTPTQSRTTGQTFAQTITGLDPKKTYHFRAFATNTAGTGYGADRTFTTLAAAPTADTDPATDITHAAAALNGELTYDGGEACDCGFEWGETVAYGNTTPTQSRTTGQTFFQIITGLDPNKTYHFRAFATNSWGTSYGADRTFQTLTSAPTVTTDAATGKGAISATINGTLDNDIGEACQCGFEWGLDTGYGTITATESKVTGETFSQVIGGLSPGTTYHFRAFATNSFGTGYGADRTFTTALVISRAYALAREEL